MKTVEMESLMMGIDVGTSGCKTILIDAAGRIVASRTVGYPLYTPQQGYAEQDPEDWWQAAIQGIRACLQDSGAEAESVVCVGFSGQMHGMVALDQNGAVIRRAILWNDQRTVAQCDEIIRLAGGLDVLLTMTNNQMLPGYTAGKILWLREKEPAHFERTRIILNPKDYVRFRLTGDYATEVSDASGTGLFDVRNRRWSTKLLNKLDIPIDMLPRCVESSEITGTITRSASELTGLKAGTLVAGGGGDAIVQTTGMGILRQGILGITIGTSGVAAMGLESFKKNDGGRLQVFCSNAPDLWHAIGVTITAGGAFQWYKNQICLAETAAAAAEQIDVYQYLDAQAAESPKGGKNLLFLPYLNGERCPYPDPDAKAAFIGLTLQHDKRDMTRSVMEGVQYSLRQVFELFTLLDKTIRVSGIITSGGGSRSKIWRQMCADVFQSPVRTVSGSAEGGAYGAAILAGVGCGIMGTLYDAVGLLRTETVTEPDPAAKNLYDHLYGIYCSLHPALSTAFHQLSQ